MPLVLAGPRGPTLWNEVDRLLSPGLRKGGELCLTEEQGMPRLVCDFQKCLCSPRCSLKDCRVENGCHFLWNIPTYLTM